MNYRFFVKMDGQEFGPYSLTEIKELPLLPDTLVTEETCLNGEWVTAETIDFEDLSRTVEEQSHPRADPPSTSTYIESDERIQGVPQETIPCVGMWNWGAFTLSWFWAVCNGIYWPLVIIVCNFIPYIGFISGLGISIYLGACGNKIAWKMVEKKGQRNVQVFIANQQKWNTVGIIFIVIMVALIGGFLCAKCGTSLLPDSISI